MTTQEQIQGYAKTLYQENKLKNCILYCATLLSLEYLDKLKSESYSLYIPDLARNLENQLNIINPSFFTENELWLDSSSFILSYLEYWHTKPKFARAVMKEFQPVLVSPSGHIQVNHIKTLQQAEDFMVGVAASRVASKLSEIINIPKLSIEELEKLLGLTKVEASLDESDSDKNLLNLNYPTFIDKDIKPLSAKTILSNIKTKTNKKNNKQVQNLLRHLPANIAAFRLECPECSKQFSPNWFRLSNEPHIPIKPNDHDGPGRWIPIKTYEICPFCEEAVPLELPVVKMQSKVMLFGDEAYREEQGKLIFTYSLVGADFKVIAQIEDSLRELKSKLCPSKSPDSWAFHMKELWSGEHRKKHRVFSDWDFEKVRFAVQGLFQLIQNHAEYLFMYNIALTVKGSMKGFKSKPALERPQDNAYILLITYVINELTTKKAQPVLQFDAEKQTKAAQVIQGWAREAFLGSQHCLLYPFLAKGIEIPEPIFVQPASQPCLELADFISYIVARFYLKKWQGKEIEEVLDTRNFGKVMYLGFDKTNDLVFHRTESYPWELFYES
ncbi:DUF3800 domain-containing protein [Anabaena sp. CA = ATCC 33047]|uniref:DUF3800 domain-containing protein n=1 Tax=Anabaena sp. (strain CA / ATCC 33047) TaxID=52271 RepID=UPI000835BC69|nr:DUF3800 domain-containing protein [Anabaena sp. CA = ATCC 33047]